ncbi:hypothetical protein CNR22_19505 [Sphingobacteriaceae bacterium]|nr:hypothetical protein CNR22_19505 [Sphingobacteriaceae bacterium]
MFIFKIKKFYRFLNIIKFTAIVSMSLRFFALVCCATLKFAKKPLVVLLLLLASNTYSQSPSSNEDLKKQANKLFEEEDYSKAYKLYSQLVSNFPKDPVYNFRLGVCMIYSEPDKKKCLPYLKFAAANSENKELKDVLFYLGKGYHINYRFDDAIKNYNAYKLNASASQIKKLEVDREIKACSYGKHLLSNLTDLEVLSKTELSENDYFRNYKKVGGKLLVKPDEFKTPADKKKKEKSVIFLPNGSDVVYYSSFGENSETGRDIYSASKQANGTFSKGEKVGGINTEFDEDYPFLHPDGKTLYFASKGHNSMGGYDIFKSVYNEDTKSWGSPVNLEFPINSPDDDFLFVTDSLETMAYFSTGRQSPPGKIDVLKVKTKRRPIDVVALKGSIIPGSPEYGLRSTINVKDVFTQNELGTYSSEEDGSYSMELPNGGKLLFTVETPGLETQSAQVSIPLASAAKNFKQTISYDKGKLKILNYFDEAVNDNSYLQYLSVIEKKAKLDVTAESPAAPLAVNTSNPEVTPESASKTNPETATETAVTPTTATPERASGMDNKQLASMARQDADESLQEAGQLHRDFVAANETGLKQKEEADKKAVEASDALFKAETISDPAERKIAVDNANVLKLAAENDQATAAKILKLAQSLDEDAKTKEKEAKLNTQYANELEKTIKKDPKASPEKLADLQKQISALPNKTNASENLVKEIKADIEQKEKQIADVEQSNTIAKTSLEEIKTAITEKETELDKTKKKAAKKELTTQIDGLKTEQDEKLKQIASNDAELKTLNEDLTVSKNQLDVATKITTEHVNAAVPVTTPAVSEKISTTSLEEKYKNTTAITDPNSRSNVEESTLQLNNFNRELDQLISKNKTEVSKTRNPDSKAKLNAEIKKAEASKKQNTSQIAANNARLTELNKLPNAEAVKNTFDPITAENSSEAVSKLDNLSTQLIATDNENFDYNGYQNVAAQNLKIEADAKINDAIAKQKKLKEDISTSKQELQKSGQTLSSEQLSKEGDEYLTQSQKLNNEAKGSKGAEKEKLLSEAKNLEEKANTKFIEAADVTRADNSAIVAANQENIQNLINDGKSSDAEVEKAKKLNEEAKIAFKKASDIRVEGNSLSTAGAKLGSFSNAEEKEAEAIQKQQQALDILTKSNTTLQLKTAITSSSAPTENAGSSADVLSKLQTVNSGLTDLAAIKIESYQKLYEANTAEIDQLVSEINANQNSANNTPSVKTDFISATNKVEAAKTLKQTSDNSANPNEKLNGLIASNKKQTEAIKQLNAIKVSLNVSSAPANVAVTSKVDTGIAVTETTTTNPDDLFFNDSPATPTAAATATETFVTDELGLLSEVDTRKIEVSQLAEKDTTTGQVLSYFDNSNVTLRNPQASSSVKTSLSQLKDIEAQEATLDNALSKVGSESEAPSEAAVNTQELNTRADVLWDEAETLSGKSFALKKEAEGKEGTEKEALLTQSKELETQSQDKMIEAADFKQQANEGEYRANTSSISELLAKLKSDDPAMASDIEARRDELSPLKTQISNLRSEANALSNKAAKLGAISNAEEKELELIQKQNVLLSELKKKYPDYAAAQSNQSPEEKTADLQQKKSQLREKQYSELTNLTNGLSLEYESSKTNVPGKLNADQQAVKANADELNAESKRLLIQSSQTKNENEKIKLLTLAAKSGNAAVEKLNKVLPKFTPATKNRGDFDDLETIGENISKSNSDVPSKPNKANTPKRNQGEGAIKIDGLEVTRGNAYSASNPIPMDAPMESGLIFRVQIGAFKTPLPNNAFKGLSPLNGETAGNGYIRYTAGNFVKVENANAVKNDLRNLGYRDAFVVVYFNGKRISLAEALAELEKQGKSVDPNAPQTAGITSNVNVPKAAANPVMLESVTVSKELEQTDGLLYTIQIGVYTKEITKSQILSLRPIFREQLKNGLYRYTAGIYNNPEKLLADKSRVVNMGIRDAFVSAYLNGKRVPFAEARDRQASNDATLKVQAENPIVFPSSNSTFVADPLEKLLVSPVTPFKNEVSNYPAPTAENGVKTNEEGITYKVQIGAFSKQVPDDVAAKFSAIRNWPVDNKQINGLFIYNIGNFGDANNAKRLKDEAVRLGITDAFVTVYRDGKKLYGPEAENYLR